MARDQVEQLGWQLGMGRRRLDHRLTGLGDAEYLWEPVQGCWNVRRRAEAASPHPMGRDEWVFDYDEEQPSPAPVTTIGWRLMHLTDVVGSYHAFLFGDGTLEQHWLEVAPTAELGLSVWGEHIGRFVSALEGDTDANLMRSVRIPWWPADAPRWRVVANVAIEVHHHGAEIAVLRDLRRAAVDTEKSAARPGGFEPPRTDP